MTAKRQQVVVKLTIHQALRTERLGQCLWPDEKLDIEEVSRRLLPEHLLWAESKREWWPGWRIQGLSGAHGSEPKELAILVASGITFPAHSVRTVFPSAAPD